MNLQIETSNLVLRPFTEDEARSRIPWFNIDKFDTSVPYVFLAVIMKSSKKYIGFVGAAPKHELNEEIELSFEIDDEYQNHGYEIEAAKTMIWWAFEQAGQSMLSAIVKLENHTSRQVLDKLGFVQIDTRELPYEGKEVAFDYFRLYHIDYLPDPEWDLDVPFHAEKMGEFFTARVGHYDTGRFEYFKEQYERLGACIPETSEPLRVLDIGCGSGIEYQYIWEKAPNAHITGVDLSDGMLDALAAKYADRKEQWASFKESYFDYEYPENTFDIVLSNQTMHHFLPEQKLPLYQNLLKTLKPGGFYLECDFIVDEPMQKAYWARYERIMKNYTKDEIGQFHIDIPCSLNTQENLLREAGFSPVIVLSDNIHDENNAAILRAEKSIHNQ